MKLPVSLSEALKAVKNNLVTMKGQKEKLTCRINKIGNEIAALQDMPLSLNDYCAFIPEYIERFGRREYHDFKRTLCNSSSGGEGNAENWGSLESENGDISGLSRLLGLGGSISMDDAGVSVMRKLCFFFPDVVAARLTETLQNDKSVVWGNDELPSMAERRDKVKQLRAERDDLTKQLEEVNAQIEEFSGFARPVSAPESTGSVQQESGEVIVVREMPGGGRGATIEDN
ncbi:hypothetical protein [Yersinia intermedia]|uniref:hypothetical protein n=1 Tax=Yersinia intermedia TaxID=631 RepID=UPI00201656F6|nr:hypothetical protein [Yersinia intermedia]